MSKKIVFCDTMIWYDVGQGDVVFDKSRYTYYGSISNIADFLSSDKSKRSEEEKGKLKRAIINMDQEADCIRMVDPTSEGSSKWFKIPIEEKEEKEFQTVYKELLRYAKGEVDTIIGPTIEGIIKSKAKFQDGVQKTKRNFDEFFKSTKHTDKEQYEIIIKNILRWLLQEWNTMRRTSYLDNQLESWKSIEVFVKTYAEFLKKVDTRQPPNQNTMIDLLQLLYIRHEDSTLLWTKELKLIAKIKSAFPENDWKDIIYQEHIKYYP